MEETEGHGENPGARPFCPLLFSFQSSLVSWEASFHWLLEQHPHWLLGKCHTTLVDKDRIRTIRGLEADQVRNHPLILGLVSCFGFCLFWSICAHYFLSF